MTTDLNLHCFDDITIDVSHSYSDISGPIVDILG